MNNSELTASRQETPIDETDSDLCRALWLAVAIQAIIDATSQSRKKSAIKAKSQARQWLSEVAQDESDFALVCDLAGVDCERLRIKFQEVLRNPEQSIDFRCLKKAGIDNRGTESRKRYFARVRKNERNRMDRSLKQNEKKITIDISPSIALISEHQTELKIAS